MFLSGQELTNEIQKYHNRIATISNQLKRKKIMKNIDLLLLFINTLLPPVIIIQSFKPTSLILVFIIYIEIYFGIKFYYTYNEYLENEINIKNEERYTLEKDIQELTNLLDYTLSYQKLEAQKQGFNIYPHIQPQDAQWVIEEYQEQYESKRIEYEKQHIEFLKQNKHYLKQKLQEAPIETYPLCEQQLLKEYQQQQKNQNC